MFKVDKAVLVYSFLSNTNKLILKHQNAAFNCCPESLSCKVFCRNDSIFILEIEKHQGCKCNCLYDLDIEIDGIIPGKYIICLIEPYASDQKSLVFPIDLKIADQGFFCVSRSIYPWSN